MHKVFVSEFFYLIFYLLSVLCMRVYVGAHMRRSGNNLWKLVFLSTVWVCGC